MNATALTLLETERRGVLVTVDDEGRPRPTPFCYAASDEDGHLVIHTPIDEKPKGTVAPDELPRVRDIRARPAVTVLVDHWDEDWTGLAWVVLRGTASELSPGDPATIGERTLAIAALRARYPQYVGHHLESRSIIRIEVESVRSWEATPGG
jgi:PPOX class probable F420-dependent enzyme